MQIDAKTVDAYNSSRKIKGEHLCHAPFANMYFNIMGQGSACWLTFTDAPKYPEHSIREIWFGSYFAKLRGNIKALALSESCRVCEKNMHRGLHANTLAQAYDLSHELAKYPQIMEFELSNRCNLECVMCNGRLSSSIRKNRDYLPAHTSPYDEEFVRQLEEFIPHLKEARFYGGEPFLQDECWAIWDKIMSINPEIEITVATNGTVWNKRVENLLARGKFRINLSIDGLSPETYEKIRKRSRFSTVIENARKFADSCRQRGTVFNIMYNPMRTNWHEIPKLVQFCNENEYTYGFNTIYRPFHLALWTLKSGDIRSIRTALLNHLNGETSTSEITNINNAKFDRFVNHQLAIWESEQHDREQLAEDYESMQTARNQAKVIVHEKLRNLAGPERSVPLLSKLETIEKLVSKNLASRDFYHHLNERPIDWVIFDLENRSAAEISEALYYQAEYY